jgi:hypothetical protein
MNVLNVAVIHTAISMPSTQCRIRALSPFLKHLKNSLKGNGMFLHTYTL